MGWGLPYTRDAQTSNEAPAQTKKQVKPEEIKMSEDKRPDPKPRKYPQLWQAYLWWREIMITRQRHNLRIAAVRAGKSNLDAEFEQMVVDDMGLDEALKKTKKIMINYGTTVPVWPWVTSIRGLGSGSLPAQLLAQIDDISRYDTVSKLWRFAGWAVIDGKAEHRAKGKKSPYNGKLKGVCWNIAKQFVIQQTPYYVDIYYAEKERQRELHPEVVKPESGRAMFTDDHIDYRGKRKMIKAFLKDLWIEWRAAEAS
jgi:hypothetical protein